MPDTSWIDVIVTAKEQKEAAEAVRHTAIAENRRVFCVLAGEFFDAVCGEVDACVDAYNKRASASLQHYPSPPDRHIVRQSVYPMGELTLTLDRDKQRLQCDYGYTLFGGKTTRNTVIFYIAAGENHLYLRRCDGSGVMQDRIAAEILSIFFTRITSIS
jgi:hypothetical protein